jgi:predicted  nucleic acid-binding Zn-ribbon protein
VDIEIHKGPLDLTRRVEDLEKQKKILQSTCRRAGEKIADLMKEEKELKDTIKKLEKHFMKRSLI